MLLFLARLSLSNPIAATCNRTKAVVAVVVVVVVVVVAVVGAVVVAVGGRWCCYITCMAYACVFKHMCACGC